MVIPTKNLFILLNCPKVFGWENMKSLRNNGLLSWVITQAILKEPNILWTWLITRTVSIFLSSLIKKFLEADSVCRPKPNGNMHVVRAQIRDSIVEMMYRGLVNMHGIG